MKKSFGSMTVEPGTKSKGFLEVTTRPDGTPVHIPLIVLNGEQEGPTLIISACIHGNETEGTLAIIRLVQTLDPKKLKGTLVCAPYLHPDAVVGRQRGSPFSMFTWDANRQFPGRANGHPTERLDYKYYNEIAVKADYIIDIHGSARFNCVAYQSYCGTNDERAWDIVQHSGAPLVGTFEAKGSINEMLLEKGITVVGLEMPTGIQEPHDREKRLRSAIKYLTNMMKHIGLVEGKPELPEAVQYIDIHKSLFKANSGGFCICNPTIRLHDHVKKGTNLYTIVNAFGEEVERVDAPFDGILMGVRTYPPIVAGEYTSLLAPIIKTIKLA